jgi:hypothetical protein
MFYLFLVLVSTALVSVNIVFAIICTHERLLHIASRLWCAAALSLVAMVWSSYELMDRCVP